MRLRVLVDLYAAQGRASALAGALELAARLQSELLGLFVEDERLLRSAALPFVRQVGRPTAAEEDFDPSRVERELRLLAARARAELERAAAARRVGCSFRRLRGAVRATLDPDAAAGPGHDIAVVCGPARSAPRAFAGCSVLYLRAHRDLSAPLVLAPGDEAAVDATLELAARLAAAGLPAAVALPGAVDEPRVRARLGAAGGAARVVVLAAARPGALERAARGAGGGLLVVRVDAPALAPLLEELALPLLVVAAPPPAP